MASDEEEMKESPSKQADVDEPPAPAPEAEEETVHEEEQKDGAASADEESPQQAGDPAEDADTNHGTNFPYAHHHPPPGWNHHNNNMPPGAHQQYQEGGYPQPSWMNPAAYPHPGMNPYWGNVQPPPPGATGPWPSETGYHTGMMGYGAPPAINPNEYREFRAWQQSRGEQHQQHSGEWMGGAPPQHQRRQGYAEKPSSPSNKNKKTHSRKRNNNSNKPNSSSEQSASASAALYPDLDNETLNAPWADLCEDAVFVCPSLRGDVSDSLYVAISQFKATALTQDDRIGKMKNRELGFTGLCCKFCGGQVRI